ncbi:MAG: NAD(P)/FAD-dependent oxidoreductase [Candidatus Micrarchaeota archaeon]
MAVDKNVVVVGASAVGSLSAAYLAQEGLDATVLEEDSKPGKFDKCGAIFSKEGLDGTGVPYHRLVLNEVRGVRIISPKAVMSVKAKTVKGVVLRRQSFDEICADYANAQGAEIRLGHRVNAYSTATNGKIRATTDKGSFESRVLVAADGIGSLAAKSFGFPAFKQTDIVLAYQAEFDNARVFDREMVDVLLDNRHYKNFFAWTIPVNESRVRVGVATTDMQKIGEAREAVFANKYIAEQLEGARKLSEFHYSIPLRYRRQTQKCVGEAGSHSYAMLVGDAAGQVKATTGGGVIFGSKCARVAAKEAAKFILEGKPPNYERAWRRQHGKILGLHYLVHRAYRLLPNPLVDVAVRVGGALGLGSLLAARGDMDYILR